LKKTLLKGEPPLLIMELPPYKRPVLRVALRHMWDRSRLFLRRAGTVILGINIVLWFLATYPRHSEISETFSQKRAAVATADKEALKKLDDEESGEHLRRSFAGMAGRALEPVIRPLGFDWKIGIGLVASFAAREVFVSTMSTVYNVGESDDEEATTKTLAETLQTQKRPDGATLYTPLLGVTLMVFYVFALQCVSTVAVVRRETNSWRWPVFQWVYMGALAWAFAFVTYKAGRALGF
jgi:ferrous iron transport protein B